MPLSIKNRKNQISHIARHIAPRVKFDFCTPYANSKNAALI